MAAYKQECQQRKRGKGPLDAGQLRDLAMSYVARYATSAARLERYLARKLHERGWREDERAPDLAALVARFVELGYVDDEAFARTRGSSLLRRGYGARRVSQSLAEAGVAQGIRDEVTASQARLRHAALVMARKRRFGPFGGQLPDHETREKQLAAMLRAGHAMDMAREMVNAASPEAAQEWAAELDEDARDEGW